MGKLAASVERFLALGCGLAALLSLGSLFEGGSLAALVPAALLLLAARWLSTAAEKCERAAQRARRRRARSAQRRTRRRLAAMALKNAGAPAVSDLRAA